MSDKVKISAFLAPEVARAAKMQSAEQGSGVSKIIRSVFLCAHCGEPITDEFIVGTPKLTEPGEDGKPDKYSVFFHKRRKECRTASGQRIAYVPVCNSCNNPAHQSFDETQLEELLLGNDVRFYCVRCDHSWPATTIDTGNLSNLLADRKSP